MHPGTLLGREDILRVIRRLLEVSMDRNEPFMEPIVMVGGTAMIAHDLRKQSYDVDLFVRDFSIDVVRQVEREFKAECGDNFRIDVTSVENVWGHIMLRDIQNALHECKINIHDRTFTLQKLSIEDLFLLKLNSDREKDRADLPVLMERTTLDKLVSRFNVIWKWHGDPDAVLGYADSFLIRMHKFGHDPGDIIPRLKLPASMIEALSEAWEEKGDASGDRAD